MGVVDYDDAGQGGGCDDCGGEVALDEPVNHLEGLAELGYVVGV